MVVLQTEMLLIPLVLVFAGVSHVLSTGTKTVCNATQFATCHGNLGEPTYLQLLPNAVGLELTCKKMTQNGHAGIFRFRNNQIVFFNESFTSSMQDRWHFVATNGTIIINQATKRDSGTYKVEINNGETGAIVANTTIQLIISGTHSTVRSILTDRTDNPSKMETHVYMVSLLSASLGVVLLCVAGGVYYVCQRRTHKPAESVGLQYAEITVLERENNQPEERMREVECCVYANVQRGQ
ncbi:uncharacterized protein LOC116225248 [Clupea harengus]|uniref:Uncharacterized protein LOC116225248 n=1 Tax=Clupea harengus TaxID=7950 RepID=A0A6P8GVU0_CLUHA|nr:uncharacterized protein LOC116225248 [Clupea harengus]